MENIDDIWGKIKFSQEDKNNIVIFGLSGSKNLAEKTTKHLGLSLGEYIYKRFADNEIFFEIKSLVRAKVVYIIQSTSNPANEKLMELLIFIDALKRASALEINVILPYFGYARQDRKNKGRQPITAKLIADLLETAGATSIASFDIHSESMQGFYNIPFDNLKSKKAIFPYLCENFSLEENRENFVVLSPDHGGVKRARVYADRCKLPLAIIDKERIRHNKIKAMNLLGEVKNKNVLIVDDMIDTGGTIIEAIKLLKENDAKDIYILAIHSVLSSKISNQNEVLEKLESVGVKALITTNTIENEERTSKILQVVDLSKILADFIKIQQNKNFSLSAYFDSPWK